MTVFFGVSDSREIQKLSCTVSLNGTEIKLTESNQRAITALALEAVISVLQFISKYK